MFNIFLSKTNSRIFYPEKVRAVLGIPKEIVVIELMPVGYPADSRKEVKREPAEKIVCYEKLANIYKQLELEARDQGVEDEDN